MSDEAISMRVLFKLVYTEIRTMLILVINTVLSPNGVHLFSLKKGKAGCLVEKTWRKAESHSKKLFPAIESVFAKTKKTWSDLDAIVAVNGPGPFTSLRVGIAVANSAGFALKIPVYSVSSDVLSLRARMKRSEAERNASSLLSSERRNNRSALSTDEAISSRVPDLTKSPDQESFQYIFAQYLISKIPEREQKKAFQPIIPIYGREPNISKPRRPLSS